MKTLARERDTTDLLYRLSGIRPDEKPRWGRMSAHQMVCHLADNFRMALGVKPVLPTTGLLQRTLVKWFALYAPVQWPPGRLQTSPEVDQEQGGTPPMSFEADVAHAEALLKRVVAEAGSLHRRPHPVFGPMGEGDWLRWAYLHTDHHLRQFGR